MSEDAFKLCQPAYAAHGIATFPVKVDAEGKIPLVRGYQNVSLRGSATLAEKFPSAPAFGFLAGPRSGITVLDVDTTDEKVLREALDKYGPTPILIKTASRKFHAFYRNNGEPRKIRRPDARKPIDILGTGVVVAPPSRNMSGAEYEFIDGCLAVIPHLPVMLAANDDSRAHKRLPPLRKGDGRNTVLFDHARVLAHRLETEEELIAMLREANQQFAEPQPLRDVLKTANKVWEYKESGRLVVPGIGNVVMMPHEVIDDLKGDQNEQDAFYLLSYLKRHHWGRDFFLANSMHKSLGWGLPRFKAAILRLVHGGYIHCRSLGGRFDGDKPQYAWGSTEKKRA